MKNLSLGSFREIRSFFGRSALSISRDMLQGYVRSTFPRQQPPKPRFLVLFVTTFCDARCIMCNIWKPCEGKQHELTPEQIQGILSDPLFREVDYLHLDGGEPTLRHDLRDIADMSLRVLPRVNKVSIVDNGLNTNRVVSSLMELHRVCALHRAHLSITISLHGIAQSLDDVRQVPGAFEREVETITRLKELQTQHGFYLSINSVITPRNVHDAPRVMQWCEERGVPVRFVVNEVRERFRNADLVDNMTFTSDQWRFVLGFLGELASQKSVLNYEAYRYRKLLDVLRGQERDLACRYELGGVMLGANAELYYCSHGKEIGNCLDRAPSEIYFDPSNVQYRRDGLLSGECRRCIPYASQEMEFYKEWPRYIGFLLSNGKRTRQIERV